MNQEVEVQDQKGFPWKALWVYLASFIIVAVLEYLMGDTSLVEETEGAAGALLIGGVIGIVIGAIILFIGLGIQYVFVKFPTQWISGQKHVYKFDIWSAIFYSGAVSIILNFMIGQLGYDQNIILANVVSVLNTVLFLFFYFSGEEKEPRVKRAITIVQIIWLVLGIVLSTIGLNALNDLGV